MSFYDTLLKLERLARMIELEHTGNTTLIADKLDVSPRTVKNLLNQLRNLGQGVEIHYCRKRNTFYYTPAARPDFNFFKKR